MRILYIADARSPIAINWIKYFIRRGDEVHVISSNPCAPDVLPGAATFRTIPIALSALYVRSPKRPKLEARVPQPTEKGSPSGRFLWLRHGPPARLVMDARYMLSAVDIYRHTNVAHEHIAAIKPQLVHAMRIPFEGILGALADPPAPLLISVWGNDFTLFAERYPRIGSLTRRAMTRTSALHCDCRRDLNLAPKWGFDPSRPSIVLPGSGGIQAEMFRSAAPDPKIAADLDIPSHADVVINPRGFRRYVRTDTFFKAIPRILEKRPDTKFLCIAMAGNPIAQRWTERLGIAASVRLLPAVDRDRMAAYFRTARITISLSEHDGTPNTLLEGMASGCFPIAGDIETAREWITDGVNGALCDPADPGGVAEQVLKALGDPQLLQAARDKNLRLIAERADYDQSMAAAARFYDEIAARKE